MKQKNLQLHPEVEGKTHGNKNLSETKWRFVPLPSNSLRGRFHAREEPPKVFARCTCDDANACRPSLRRREECAPGLKSALFVSFWGIGPHHASTRLVSFSLLQQICVWLWRSFNVFPSSSGAQEYIYYLWAKALRRAKDKIIFLGCQLPLMSSKQINIHDLELVLVWVTEYRYDLVRVMWLPVKPKFILLYNYLGLTLCGSDLKL